MKHLLIALLALALIAGCNKTEEPANTDKNGTDVAAEDTSMDDTNVTSSDESTDPDGDDTGEVTGQTDDTETTSAPSASSKGLVASLKGGWTGKLELDPAQIEEARKSGISEEQIQQQLSIVKGLVFKLELRDDMTFTMSAQTPGGPQSADSTWEVKDDKTIILNPPKEMASAGGSEPSVLVVSSDKKTLTMNDPSGQSKTKTVYKKD